MINFEKENRLGKSFSVFWKCSDGRQCSIEAYTRFETLIHLTCKRCKCPSGRVPHSRYPVNVESSAERKIMRILTIHFCHLTQHEYNVTSALGDRKSGGCLHPLKSLLRREARGVGFLMRGDNPAIGKYNGHCRVRVFNRCHDISVADEILNQ